MRFAPPDKASPADYRLKTWCAARINFYQNRVLAYSKPWGEIVGIVFRMGREKSDWTDSDYLPLTRRR